MTAQPSPRGRFITLEGGEGAGKSVQVRRLEERLAALGLAVVRTREPGGSTGAEALREAILYGFAAQFKPAGQAFLFAAARVDLLDKTILPTLASGAWVVSDRFADSTRAYQGAAGNLSPEFIACLERLTVGANRPDLTLILDIPPEVGLKRAAERRQGGGRADRFNQRDCPFTKPSGGRSSTSPPPSLGAASSSTPTEPKRPSPPPFGRRSRCGLIPYGIRLITSAVWVLAIRRSVLARRFETDC